LTGNDYIVGDIHGNRECLDEVLKIITPNDRLFIVGDLIDRGEDNLGVLARLREHPGNIFAVRGNHEQMVLDSIIHLENILKELAVKGHDVKDLELIMQRINENPELQLHMDAANGGQ